MRTHLRTRLPGVPTAGSTAAKAARYSANIRGIEFQQGIWRYHPKTKEFELFAEGGGNTWGIDFDRFGNLFAGGNTLEPLCHHVQGAYYVKGFGKHGPLHNPYSFGYFPPVEHIGPFGGGLTGGNVIYQGTALPERFTTSASARTSGRTPFAGTRSRPRGARSPRSKGGTAVTREIFSRRAIPGFGRST